MSRRAPTLLAVAVLAVLTALAALTSCGERDPAEPEGPSESQVVPPGLSVSDPGPGDESVAYISAGPGSFPGGQSVTITNLANGASASVPMIDGGFDPVALPAEPDDQLEIVIDFADGSTASFVVRLPMRRPPRVVRTRPPKGETDVVLNATATVVFSEPIDSSTVTEATVQLRLDGDPVEGILTLSEDGLRAEFVPAQPLQPGSSYTLVITREVLDLDGDPLQEELRTTFTTAFSTASPPDIVFLSNPYGDWDIHGVNADGSGRVNLSGRAPGDEGDPAWSPDGSKIAFTSRRDGNAEIYLMNADGTGPVRLTNSPSHEKSPVWSADGSRIAFISMLEDRRNAVDVDTYVMKADGSRRVKVNAPSDAWAPAWSPTGSRIALVSRDSHQSYLDIYVINTNGIAGPVNVTNSMGVDEEFPVWSPDGSKIAFRTGVGIWLMNPDGSGTVNLTNSGTGVWSHAWSPDGSKIAFTSRRDGNAEIYVVNADGTGQVNLTNSEGSDEEHPAWSPDGSKIAFTSTRNGNPEIYLMNADGTGWVRLTQSPADDISPEWRPQR